MRLAKQSEFNHYPENVENMPANGRWDLIRRLKVKQLLRTIHSICIGYRNVRGVVPFRPLHSAFSQSSYGRVQFFNITLSLRLTFCFVIQECWYLSPPHNLFNYLLSLWAVHRIYIYLFMTYLTTVPLAQIIKPQNVGHINYNVPVKHNKLHYYIRVFWATCFDSYRVIFRPFKN